MYFTTVKCDPLTALLAYCGMYTRCWATTAEEAANQQPLLSNGFSNKHVSTATITQ
jgi:hypothetical protein